MTYNRLRLGAQGIIFLLSFALVAYGQTISGSISGHVYDAQMAPIQGATVTVTDSSKNFSAVTKPRWRSTCRLSWTLAGRRCATCTSWSR